MNYLQFYHEDWEDAESEELKVYPEAGSDTTMGIIQRDCNGFWHYLAFRPVLSASGTGELTRQALWRKRMVHLMGTDHPAAELLQTDSQDTARSVLLRPLVQPKPRKHHVSEALMQAQPRGASPLHQESAPSRIDVGGHPPPPDLMGTPPAPSGDVRFGDLHDSPSGSHFKDTFPQPPVPPPRPQGSRSGLSGPSDEGARW